MKDQKSIQPSVFFSLLPVLLLIVLLVVNVFLFKDDASYGANQIALLVSGALCAFIGIVKYKLDFKVIETGVVESIKMSMQAVLILLVVGSLIGLWISSGVVPAMIYYGLNMINPTFFLPISCVVCMMVSISTGSSWSTTGTVGIALIAIGQTLGINEGMVAGAIISGAYFGDKMSPLSDTTNLAPAMAGTDLFTHIRYMMITTIPSISLALIGFLILGLFFNGDNLSSNQISDVSSLIDKNFNITPILFIIPAAVIFMIYKKVSALPAMFLGCIFGAIGTMVFQWDLVIKAVGDKNLLIGIYEQIVSISFGGYSMESGNAFLDKLLSRGGMSGMMNTIWLILTAMVFGGAMEATNMLHTLANLLLKKVESVGMLVGKTLASCIFINLTASDQYLAIVVPGRMFKQAYDEQGLAPENLSRALEDAGTVTSVLIPWNSGGAYNSSVLGVATLTYLPFCFFNLISPFMSFFIASMGKGIRRTVKA